jgi:D-lactate dehydrogenase (cytochrome)
MLTDLWMKLIEKHHGNIDKSWIALNEKEKSEFETLRHSISAEVNEFISSHNYRKLGTDFAVPDRHLKNFYERIKNEVKSAGLDYVIYGHFGNSHIHLNMLPKNDDEFELSKKLYTKICLDAIKTGGTFSAEHGVGKNKTELLLEMYGEQTVKEMFEIKKALDPNLILCPGNIFNQDWIKIKSAG